MSSPRRPGIRLSESEEHIVGLELSTLRERQRSESSDFHSDSEIQQSSPSQNASELPGSDYAGSPELNQITIQSSSNETTITIKLTNSPVTTAQTPPPSILTELKALPSLSQPSSPGLVIPKPGYTRPSELSFNLGFTAKTTTPPLHGSPSSQQEWKINLHTSASPRPRLDKPRNSPGQKAEKANTNNTKKKHKRPKPQDGSVSQFADNLKAVLGTNEAALNTNNDELSSPNNLPRTPSSLTAEEKLESGGNYSRTIESQQQTEQEEKSLLGKSKSADERSETEVEEVTVARRRGAVESSDWTETAFGALTVFLAIPQSVNAGVAPWKILPSQINWSWFRSLTARPGTLFYSILCFLGSLATNTYVYRKFLPKAARRLKKRIQDLLRNAGSFLHNLALGNFKKAFENLCDILIVALSLLLALRAAQAFAFAQYSAMTWISLSVATFFGVFAVLSNFSTRYSGIEDCYSDFSDAINEEMQAQRAVVKRLAFLKPTLIQEMDRLITEKEYQVNENDAVTVLYELAELLQRKNIELTDLPTCPQEFNNHTAFIFDLALTLTMAIQAFQLFLELSYNNDLNTFDNLSSYTGFQQFLIASTAALPSMFLYIRSARRSRPSASRAGQDIQEDPKLAFWVVLGITLNVFASPAMTTIGRFVARNPHSLSHETTLQEGSFLANWLPTLATIGSLVINVPPTLEGLLADHRKRKLEHPKFKNFLFFWDNNRLPQAKPLAPGQAPNPEGREALNPALERDPKKSLKRINHSLMYLPAPTSAAAPVDSREENDKVYELTPFLEEEKMVPAPAPR